MAFVLSYLRELAMITNELSPYLLLGFVVAGVLHILFPTGIIHRFMGRNSFLSSFNAAMFGIPLPLCSCGVIPTGISLSRSGASRGASVSFLISTPQTGVDSILVTWSLLGLPFAVLRMIIALVTGVVGGMLTSLFTREKGDGKQQAVQTEKIEEKGSVLYRMFNYAFVVFLQDIALWLVIGVFIAAFISTVLPADFFTAYIGSDYLSMLLVLAASVPMYVCATGSVPIVAALMMKGLSPGAALVFLMAGPATNAATITVIGRTLGRKTLLIYLISIIGGALLFGTLLNEFMPTEWFSLPSFMTDGHGGHDSVSSPWVGYGSSIVLVLLILNAWYRRYFRQEKKCSSCDLDDRECEHETEEIMEQEFIVDGMTCNHCKMAVEKAVQEIDGVENADVDLAAGTVTVRGTAVDVDAVAAKISETGYTFGGAADK